MVTRRTFLKGAGICLGTMYIQGCAVDNNYENSEKLFSYSTVGFRDRDLEHALNAIAEIGFKGTEIMAIEPHLKAKAFRGNILERLHKHLKKLELEPTVHAPLGKITPGMPDDTSRGEAIDVLSDYLYFASNIQAKEMIVHPVPNPVFVSEPNNPVLPRIIYDSVRNSLDTLIPIAEKCGVRILFENLPYHSNYPLRTTYQLREFMSAMDYDEKYLGLCVDTGHSAVLGNDPAGAIRVAGDRLHAVHLQDIDTILAEDNHWVPTHGNLNWKKILSALVDINYKGAWTFECYNSRHGETPMELAKKCYRIAMGWHRNKLSGNFI